MVGQWSEASDCAPRKAPAKFRKSAIGDKRPETRHFRCLEIGELFAVRLVGECILWTGRKMHFWSVPLAKAALVVLPRWDPTLRSF